MCLENPQEYNHVKRTKISKVWNLCHEKLRRKIHIQNSCVTFLFCRLRIMFYIKTRKSLIWCNRIVFWASWALFVLIEAIWQKRTTFYHTTLKWLRKVCGGSISLIGYSSWRDFASGGPREHGAKIKQAERLAAASKQSNKDIKRKSSWISLKLKGTIH